MAFLLLVCGALAGCGGLTRHGPLDPALSAFIPSDAVTLVGVRMDQIRATPLYRKLAARNRAPRFDEFLSDPNFELVSDVHELLVASDGHNLLAAAHGDFKSKRPSGLPATPYNGVQLFVKDERGAVAFLDDHTALGGSPAAVRAAIDRWRAGVHRAPPDLLARVDALPPDTEIWAVAAGWQGAGSATLREMGNAANLDRVLRLVEGANLTIDLRAGAHAAATGDCRTEADARTLSESLRGLAGLARLGVPKSRPDLQRVFDGIQVTQDGHVVKVNVDIPEDLADKLLQ